MNTQSIYRYRLDYIIYLAIIVFLDIVAIHHPKPYFFLIPIGIVWLHMLFLSIQNLKKKRIGTEFFLVFATIIALIGRQEKAIMFVLLIMLIARYIELLIEQRTHNAIENLIKLIPSTVLVMENNQEKIMPLEQVISGMHILVKTGGRIPADGFIIEGSATINEALLTGESMPRSKQVNDRVFAGTFIESGSIIFQVERVKQETLFGRMTSLFSQSEEKKARITLLTNKIAFILVPLILLFILLVWVITRNLELVITLLIFGSPLELSLVTPLTILAGTIAAFRRGIIVRGGRALEQLAHIDTMIFDKTGTLTLGEPVVVDIQTYDQEYTVNDILKIGCIAEIRSDHVLAKAILKKARELNIEIPQPESYTSLAGHGVEIMYQNKRYFLGNKHFIEAPEHGNSPMGEEYVKDDSYSYSNFYLASEGKLIGKISITDVIRPDAKQTIGKLRNAGISDIILVSGDRQLITHAIAQQLGITQAYGDTFPEQKLELLDTLQKQGHIVGMVGDGINDVAALKQAHVGIAMGAMGMEPAIEAADIVLMTNELENIFFMRELSKKVFRVIKENLIIGFIILHFLGLVFTLMHIIDPIQAAFFHAISDVVILLNASRLIAFKSTR